MPNGSTLDVPEVAVACWTNATRSSAVNSVAPLRTGRLTTATMTWSNIADGARDHVEVAVGDRVVGAGADRDSVIGGHGCGSVCLRNGARAAAGGRARAARAGRSRRRRVPPARGPGQARADSSARRALAMPVWGVEEDKIVLTARAVRLQRAPRSAGDRSTRPRARARRGCARSPRSPPARESTNVALGGPARQRLDRQRARSGEQVEHPRRPSTDTEDREQRLADAIRRSGGSRRAAPRGRARGSCPRSRASPQSALTRGSAPSRLGAVAVRSASAEQRVLGLDSSSGSRVDHARPAGRARPLEQLCVRGQLGEPDVREPVTAGCRSARPRRAAEGRSRPARNRRSRGERLQPRASPWARTAGTATRARRARSGRAADAAARSRSARRPRPASRSRSGRRSRPRSPTSRRARRLRRRRSAPSPPASRAGASARAAARPGNPGTGRRAAARTRPSRPAPASASDSSTSGQTTNAWRPARSSSRIRSYARSRSASLEQTWVVIGWRPRGSSRRTVKSRSP